MAFQRNKRENLKDKCLSYLGGKRCKRCGIDSLPHCCYDFHHLNPALKEFEISKVLGTGIKWSKLKAELDKCIIVCKNCHALLTYTGERRV